MSKPKKSKIQIAAHIVDSKGFYVRRVSLTSAANPTTKDLLRIEADVRGWSMSKLQDEINERWADKYYRLYRKPKPKYAKPGVHYKRRPKPAKKQR